MDRITNLLNDNDKLFEKRKQQAASNKYEYNEESQSLEDDEGDDDDEDADDQELDQEESERKDEENNSGSSATLTPSSSHIVAATTTTVAPAEVASGTRRVEYKHDRLKKICSMALDLQTKLQQTKLKLFGLNSNDESLVSYDEKDAHEAVSFDKVFRQHSNAKDQAERLNIDQDVQQVLPGVGPLRFLENDDMSRPMIDNSRKNQSSYLDSKQARAKIVNNYDNNTSTSPKKDANESSKAQKYVQGVVGQKQAARTTKPSKQIELDNEVADELAFINVFKKRASELMPSNENPKESKYYILNK